MRRLWLPWVWVEEEEMEVEEEESKTTVRRIACCAYFKSSWAAKCNVSCCHMPHATCHMAEGVGYTQRLLLAPWGRLIELTFNLVLHLHSPHSGQQRVNWVRMGWCAQWVVMMWRTCGLKHRREAITIQLRDIYKLIKFVCFALSYMQKMWEFSMLIFWKMLFSFLYFLM